MTIGKYHIKVINEQDHLVEFLVSEENGGPDHMEETLSFTIKWDGCIDINGNLIHLCNFDQLKDYMRCHLWMIQYAMRSMPEHEIDADELSRETFPD